MVFLEERIRDDPDFNFEPVGVEISVVVSHSPNSDPEQEPNLDQDPGVDKVLELLNLDPTESSVSVSSQTDPDPALVGLRFSY